jgi:hypothetical protein
MGKSSRKRLPGPTPRVESFHHPPTWRGREAVDALTPKLDHIVIDCGDQIAADAEAIRLLRQRVPVVTFVNNHFAGFAPETVRQLKTLMDRATSA